MKNKPTKLLPTDLIVAEVPSDARGFKIIKTELQTILRYFTGNIEWKGISFPKTDFEILGEINKDKISVDYKKFPQVSLTGEEARLLLDHNDNIDLRKLLQSNGLNWVNPIEKPKGTNLESSFFEMQVDFNQEKLFEEAEEKLIKGKLIIFKTDKITKTDEYKTIYR